MPEQTLVHFSWYGPLTSENRDAALLGPLQYAEKYPEQLFVYWCRADEKDAFKEAFKEHPKVIVQSIDDELIPRFEKLGQSHSPLVDRMKKLLSDVNNSQMYFNLGKELSQFMSLALYGGYHLDTTVRPNPEDKQAFQYYDQVIQFGGEQGTGPDVWATYVPNPAEAPQSSKDCSAVVEQLLENIEGIIEHNDKQLKKPSSLADINKAGLFTVGKSIAFACLKLQKDQNYEREIGKGRATTVIKHFSGIKEFGKTNWIRQEPNAASVQLTSNSDALIGSIRDGFHLDSDSDSVPLITREAVTTYYKIEASETPVSKKLIKTNDLLNLASDYCFKNKDLNLATEISKINEKINKNPELSELDITQLPERLKIDNWSIMIDINEENITINITPTDDPEQPLQITIPIVIVEKYQEQLDIKDSSMPATRKP